MHYLSSKVQAEQTLPKNHAGGSARDTMAFKRQSRLQAYLASQYVEFDPENPSQRLNSLYFEFSKISAVNPYAYNLNVAYWRSVILDCNMQGLLGCTDYKLAIHANDVSDAFLRPGLGKPISLDCVLREMLQNGDIMRMDDFAYAYTSPTTSWLSWMSGRFRRWLPGSEQKLFVVMPTVKALARQIIETRNRQKTVGPSDHLYTLSEFREKYGKICESELTDGDLWLLIRYMSAEFGIAVADHVQGYGASYVAIKFPEKSELETRRAYITQQDKAIISIRTTCHALQIQVDNLQAKSEELLASSKEHYSERRKPQALYALKRKKNVEEILARRLRSLETMETMLMKIEASQNDLQVVRAFNVGADALRNILQKEDLSIAMVDEALLKVQRAFEDQREVEDAIAQRVEEANQSQMPPDFDEEALEKELEDLEAQAREPSPDIRERSSPPPREETVSAPPPSQSESELVRLDQIVASLRQAGQPPSRIPPSGSPYKDMEPAM